MNEEENETMFDDFEFPEDEDNNNSLDNSQDNFIFPTNQLDEQQEIKVPKDYFKVSEDLQKVSNVTTPINNNQSKSLNNLSPFMNTNNQKEEFDAAKELVSFTNVSNTPTETQNNNTNINDKKTKKNKKNNGLFNFNKKTNNYADFNQNGNVGIPTQFNNQKQNLNTNQINNVKTEKENKVSIKNKNKNTYDDDEGISKKTIITLIIILVAVVGIVGTIIIVNTYKKANGYTVQQGDVIKIKNSIYNLEINLLSFNREQNLNSDDTVDYIGKYPSMQITVTNKGKEEITLEDITFNLVDENNNVIGNVDSKYSYKVKDSIKSNISSRTAESGLIYFNNGNTESETSILQNKVEKIDNVKKLEIEVLKSTRNKSNQLDIKTAKYYIEIT